eukprot:g79358.t1
MSDFAACPRCAAIPKVPLSFCRQCGFLLNQANQTSAAPGGAPASSSITLSKIKHSDDTEDTREMSAAARGMRSPERGPPPGPPPDWAGPAALQGENDQSPSSAFPAIAPRHRYSGDGPADASLAPSSPPPQPPRPSRGPSSPVTSSFSSRQPALPTSSPPPASSTSSRQPTATPPSLPDRLVPSRGASPQAPPRRPSDPPSPRHMLQLQPPSPTNLRQGSPPTLPPTHSDKLEKPVPQENAAAAGHKRASLMFPINAIKKSPSVQKLVGKRRSDPDPAVEGVARNSSFPSQQRGGGTLQKTQTLDGQVEEPGFEAIPHLFETVAKQTEAGLSVMTRLSAFMQVFVSAHEKFIDTIESAAHKQKSKLLEMNPKTGVDNMGGTFLSVLDFFGQIENLMRTYREHNEIMSGNCLEPLVKHTEQIAKRQQEMQDRLHACEAERQQNQLRVKQQRKYCSKLIAALNEKKTTHLEKKEKEKHMAPVVPKGMIGKLKQGMTQTTKSTGKAMEKAREKARNACIQYKELLEVAENFQRGQHERDFPHLVNEMGQSEALRVEHIANTLTKFQALTIRFSSHFKEAAESLTATFVDSKKDISSFVAKCLREYGPPKPPLPFNYDLAFSPDDLTAENFSASLFSSSLEAVLSYEQNLFPDLQLQVPRVVEVLIEAIEKNGGTTSEGIFRLSASQDLMVRMRKQLESGDYELEVTGDPNPPAALLKAWLRDLAEPVIPFSQYPVCVALGRSDKRTPEEVRQALGALPELNRRVLARVLGLCQKIHDNAAATRMTFSNLAIVFAPAFLQGSNLDPMQELQDSKYACNFVEDLMSNHLFLFGSAS